MHYNEKSISAILQATLRTEKNAKALRKPLTPAEKLFWQIVRNRNLLGLKFRRQHPIGPFIADFYCHDLKLVVEIDGDVHALEKVKQYDKERGDYLKELGLQVLRFKNEDVFLNAHVIEEELKAIVSGSKLGGVL